MKKQGFTLIELLAVIVILGLLAMIIVPNVTKTLKTQKENLYNIQIKEIEDAAKSWAADNFFKLPTTDGMSYPIYLKDLNGFIDTDIENPKDSGKKFGQCLKVVIALISGTGNYTYEVDENTIYDQPTSDNCS